MNDIDRTVRSFLPKTLIEDYELSILAQEVVWQGEDGEVRIELILAAFKEKGEAKPVRQNDPLTDMTSAERKADRQNNWYESLGEERGTVKEEKFFPLEGDPVFNNKPVVHLWDKGNPKTGCCVRLQTYIAEEAGPTGAAFTDELALVTCPALKERETTTLDHSECCKYVNRPYPHNAYGKCLGNNPYNGDKCAWHPNGCPQIDVFSDQKDWRIELKEKMCTLHKQRLMYCLDENFSPDRCYVGERNPILEAGDKK